jgi:hypothetical protein
VETPILLPVTYQVANVGKLYNEHRVERAKDQGIAAVGFINISGPRHIMSIDNKLKVHSRYARILICKRGKLRPEVVKACVLKQIMTDFLAKLRRVKSKVREAEQGLRLKRSWDTLRRIYRWRSGDGC